MPRPIRATIDLGALKHNLAVARQHAATGPAAPARLFSVIKANAYGHGILPVARALAGLTDGFALLDLNEAARLREAGIREPILLLEGFFQPEDLETVAELGLIPVVHRLEQLQAIEAAALPVKLPVFIKFNTGMHRLGFTAETWPDARAFLARSRAVGPATYMTHFAEADSERGIDWQLERFQLWTAGWQGEVSLANSAALLRHPAAVRGWARPGIMLYGGSPFPETSAEALGLLPVMTLESEILAVQEVAPGERVGYGGIFQAERPSRIGIVACGYADGYPRHAPPGTPILVAGKPTVTAGRVAMDMLFCDLTELPEVGAGAPVTLWGKGLAADAVAAAAGTISYELFCALAPRVPVHWVGN